MRTCVRHASIDDVIDLTCKTCGGTFQAERRSGTGPLYCGPDCKREARRVQQRENYWRRPEQYREAQKRYVAENSEKVNERQREYRDRPENREKARERTRAWREANPERKRELNVRWRAENREKLRARLRREKYELTDEQFEAMSTAQGGVCAICGSPPAPARRGGEAVLYVDHDHRTGAVRGLLCRTCNTGIGMLGDDPEILRRAIEYLERASS